MSALFFRNKYNTKFFQRQQCTDLEQAMQLLILRPITLWCFLLDVEGWQSLWREGLPGGEVTKFQIKQIKATGLISKSTTLYPYNFFGYNVVELPSSSHRWRNICHCNLMWRTSTHDKLHRPLTTSIVFSKMLEWRELLNWASNDIVYGVKYHTVNSHFEYLWRCY